MKKAGGEVDPADLPPELPDWLAEIWRLYERVRTQWRVGPEGRTGLDYNPVIALVASVGASERLWKILEFLQVIEFEAMRKPDEGGDG